MANFLRQFGGSLFLTVFAVAGVWFWLGLGAMLVTLVLIAIEIAFSFDNAIVNAKVLDRLGPLWRQLFLTLGVVIAIVGMRLVFPILIVMLGAHLPWHDVLNLALHQPEEYARHLDDAHTVIASFGGGFLLVLVLYFFFDDDRTHLWIKGLERPLQKIGTHWWTAPLVGLLAVGLLSLFAGADAAKVARAGAFGVLLYAAITLFINWLGRLTGAGRKGAYTGWAAFIAFMYLQLLDASFSFDGVLGAFAITNKVVLIAIGLGIGALWVRSLTVFMVRHKTLDSYIYLEHGAHYAILVLAAALLLSVFWNVPDAITGIVGLGVIGASLMASRQALRSRHDG